MATMASPHLFTSLNSRQLSSLSPLPATYSSDPSSASIRTVSSQFWLRNSSVPCKASSGVFDARADRASSIRSSSSSSRGSKLCAASSSLLTSLSLASSLPISHSLLTFKPLSSPRSSSLFVPQAKKVSDAESSVEKEEQLAGAPVEEEEEEEEEVEISWIEEKAEDLIYTANQAIDRVPGPRVGNGRLPWLVAVPLGYLGITFVIAVVKTFRKYNSPRGQRKRQVGKNAFLCEALEDYFPSKRDQLDSNTLQKLANQCKFSMSEILRKYVRYVLNERPFVPDTVADLIHLRKVSGLTESEVADVLNDVAKRVVKAKGPVVMNTEGFTEKGLKRKAAVQALFSKLLYLSEMEEFVSSENRSALTIKTTFGLTDEDANKIRIDTLSEESDVESLERMVGSADSESDNEESSSPTSEGNEKR